MHILELTYGTLLRNSLGCHLLFGDRLDALRQRHLLNWRSNAKNLARVLGTEADFLLGLSGL